MPRGGPRVGSGPKGRRADMDVVPFTSSDVISKDPPTDLPAAQRDFWTRCAAVAIAKRTLTRQTVEAFRLLAELDAERRETKKQLDAAGRVYEKVWIDSSGQEHAELRLHPLANHYRALAKQQENMMLKFTLMPFGKPVASPPSVNDRKRASARMRFFGPGDRG